MTFDINNNTLTGSKGEAIRVRSTATGATTGTATGYVRNNTIGDAATANSGSSEGSGIFFFGDGGSDMTVVADNNDVFSTTITASASCSAMKSTTVRCST